ncbi:MAG: DUF302 domain-containing protein [Candidatus Hydrogenedentes bacterium]|nr:DUF302 domain-containing protein [Candidatus Hydrogenedentota bacterium]
MLYMRETKGTVEEAVQRIEAATVACGFGVLHVHDLKAKMAAKGVAFEQECKVLEVCNPKTTDASRSPR